MLDCPNQEQHKVQGQAVSTQSKQYLKMDCSPLCEGDHTQNHSNSPFH